MLENNRALLRPLQTDDYDHLLPFSLQEPGIWTYSLQPADGAENLKAYLEAAVNGRLEKREYPFIVFDKQKNAYAGSTRFYDIQVNNASLQLGYTWYGGDFQGTGLNRHCKYLLLDFAFDELGFERVEFRADALNERSIRAMKGIGCTVEGILRSHAFRADGTRRDTIILSILRTEWEARIRQELSMALQ